jgi:hypothetical protein
MVLLLSEENPTAALFMPVARLKRAACPSAVLVASVRRRTGCLRYRRPETDQRQRDENS